MMSLKLLKKTTALILTSLILLSAPFIPTPIDAASSTESETIIAIGNISDYTWSLDGTQVAYVTHLENESWGELWIGDWDGTQLTNLQLVYSQVELSGLLDWQGDWILFQMRRENGVPEEYYGRGELWKIRANGTDLTQVTYTYTNGIKHTENGYYYFRGSAGWGKFLPGTNRVYFSAHDGNGWWQAYTCKADGTDEWQRVSGNSYSFTIGMSPKGNKLVYGTSWYWDQPTTLMSCNPDGSGTITMKQFSFKTSPLVLADGNTVMYNHPDGNIGAIQVDGTDDKVVIDDEYGNYLVNYNPIDGQSFLMRSNRSLDGNNHIFCVDVAGTGIVQLTYGPYDVDSAMYSPDGHSLLFRRYPLNTLNASYELVITGIARQIEDLPSASVRLLLVGEDPEDVVNATITIGFYSNGNRIGIGFHQKVLHTTNGSSSIAAIGLGYDELREYSHFSTTQGDVIDNTLNPGCVSHRHYAAWTASEWSGTWNGPISDENITDAIFCSDIIEIENLRVYFEDGSSSICGPQLIRLTINFTKTGEIWNTDIAIETSSSDGVSIENEVLTIPIRFPEYLSPVFYLTLISTIAIVIVVVGVFYLKGIRNTVEYHDEYVTYY